MATAPTVILPIKADPRGFIEFARVVGRHMTALADDLEQMDGPARLGLAVAAENERIRKRAALDEFAVVVKRAFQDAGAIHSTDDPTAAVLAAAAKLAP